MWDKGVCSPPSRQLTNAGFSHLQVWLFRTAINTLGSFSFYMFFIGDLADHVGETINCWNTSKKQKEQKHGSLVIHVLQEEEVHSADGGSRRNSCRLSVQRSAVWSLTSAVNMFRCAWSNQWSPCCTKDLHCCVIEDNDCNKHFMHVLFIIMDGSILAEVNYLKPAKNVQA